MPPRALALLISHIVATARLHATIRACAAPWLNTPNPQAQAILHANILRYLLTEHSEGLAALVEFQDPRIWLAQVLEQARAWQWRGPQQLEFLVVRRLEEATQTSVIRWQPMPEEAPGDHFERVLEQWRRLREKV